MRRSVFILFLALVPVMAAAEEPPQKLTLEALFEDKALELEQITDLEWLPSGQQIIYFTSHGEEQTLWGQHVTTGERTELADWSAVLEDLAEQRPDFAKPKMSDVNSSASHRTTPVLSPDGKKLAFTSTRSGSFDIWIMHVNQQQIKKELGLGNPGD